MKRHTTTLHVFDPDDELATIEKAAAQFFDIMATDKEKVLAAGDALAAFDRLRDGLTGGGSIPTAWRHATRPHPDGVRPNLAHDAFVLVEPYGCVIRIDGENRGTAPTETDAEEKLERLLVDMEYWPYVWKLHTDTGVCQSIDMQCDGWAWWLSKRDDDDPYGPFEHDSQINPADVHRRQAVANIRNQTAGWRQWTVVREPLYRPGSAPTPDNMPGCRQFSAPGVRCGQPAPIVAKSPVTGEPMPVCPGHARMMDEGLA